MIALFAASLAHATAGFDATTPAAHFDGAETFTQDGAVELWSAIDRWADPDSQLFTVEAYNSKTEWHDTAASPHIATLFGTAQPRTGAFLLHAGPSEAVAHGTPILFVPGAGDNASRGFISLATHEDRLFRPVYAITFAHPHGDVFQQAEAIADALAVIEARTGASQVDVVAHSKGGIAAAVYASNTASADWGNTATANAYETVGTAYRGDVRRLVLIATPLGGIDLAYRWPANNLFGLDADTALAPVSWSAYYPYGTGFPASRQDLSEQDLLPADGDLFPGQRQLLHRQEPSLPYTQSWLGGYATAQLDNLSTYEGGIGFYSTSDGIDAAIQAGGGLIDRLAQRGVDPRIAVFLLAGKNPLMPNADADLAAMWEDMGIGEDDWASFLAGLTSHGVPVTADEDELDGLQRGKLVLGEVTGIADGVVFTSSALDAAAVDHRGAVVTTHTANLSHLDLLYASPITGQLLIDAANDGTAADAWMRGVGRRYTAEDTIGWVEDALADPEVPDTDVSDTADTGGSDTDAPPGDTDGAGPPGDSDSVPPRPCGGCGTAGGGPLGLIALAGLALRWRRIRTA
jgi:hypothetical protein